MKKLMLLAASGLMIAGMTSCKKDYTCNCTTNVSYTSTDTKLVSVLGFDYRETEIPITSKQKKKDSEKWCKDKESSDSKSETQSVSTGEYDLVTFELERKDVTVTETSATTCSL